MEFFFFGYVLLKNCLRVWREMKFYTYLTCYKTFRQTEDLSTELKYKVSRLKT